MKPQWQREIPCLFSNSHIFFVQGFMKISASVYSNTEKPLEELVKELDRYRVDFFHIDCNDDLTVFDDISRIRKISKTPVDLHIISSEPEKFFDGIVLTKTEMVSFQFENLKSPLKIPSSVQAKLGLAIVSETQAEVFYEYQDQFDFVLFMTTTPGKSGGKFNRENFRKIRKFKTLFQKIKINVDGGVNDEVSFVLRNMGVSLVVSGSYLVNSEYIGEALHNLRSDNTESHILIGDFMISKEESPVLQKGNFSFREVLQSIEEFNQGYTTVIDEKGMLSGIITNADVRKGLLKNIDNINNLNPENIINRNPVTVNHNNSVAELLQKIKSLNFPVLFMPVVDEENKLVGTVTFNNLIKGES